MIEMNSFKDASDGAAGKFEDSPLGNKVKGKETNGDGKTNYDASIAREIKNAQKLHEFSAGKIAFDEVKEIFAEHYADAVNSNKPWSWMNNIPEGENLTPRQRKDISEYAREKGLVPNVPIREENGKRYADFSAFKKFECQLDKEDWDKTDNEQFAKCNEKLRDAIEKNPKLAEKFTKEQIEQISRGETPTGYTWHHYEKDGVMQLVPFGVHNSINHYGGRSEGHWADASRH
jgi:hypothetical protein